MDTRGFRSLDAPDAFLTHRIGGVPIVVQNTAAGLRAYVNRCAHRHAPIQVDDFGARRLACPYHGWVYDGDGGVQSTGERGQLRLRPDSPFRPAPGTGGPEGRRRARVREPGRRADADRGAVPSGVPRAGRASERSCRRRRAVREIRGALQLEAQLRERRRLEPCPLRARRELRPSLAPSPSRPLPVRPASPPPQPDAEISGDLRDLSYESRASFDLPSWPWHDAVERCGGATDYVNYFLYPNVNYIVMSGAIHLVQQYCPVAADRTEYRLTMALGRRRQRLPAAAAILWGQMKSEKRVIDEDAVVLEALQSGLSGDAPPAFHGAYEFRLRRIAKVYRRLLEAA
ncbi:MAG: Rieske 2Fe-2S domain-containing protein [Burkholderiales bacterium]